MIVYGSSFTLALVCMANSFNSEIHALAFNEKAPLFIEFLHQIVSG